VWFDDGSTARAKERSRAMDEAGFHQDLRELLDDPITHWVMASDKVDMPDLVALLRSAGRGLRRSRPDPRSDQ
jgi:hypothetical protein